MIRAAVWFAMGSVFAGLGCAQLSPLARPSSAARLVSTTPLPDPHVLHDGASWYVFGTNSRPYFFLQGKSLDPTAMQRKPLTLDFAGRYPKSVQIWGAAPYRHTDGTWHLYATLHLGHFKTIIGHFLPAAGQTWKPGNPITRWVLASVLLGGGEANPGYYESKAVRDSDGTLYLIYVGARQKPKRENWIYARRMRSPGKLDPKAAPVVLLRPEGYRSEDRNLGGMQLVEGTSITRLGGTFVLLYSVGDYARANYKLGVAYSDTLIPAAGKTYVKPTAPDPKRVWGNKTKRDEVVYLLQSEKPAWPNFSAKHVVGPGLGSVVMIDSKPWLVFHGYRPGTAKDGKFNPAQRFVFRAPLQINIKKSVPMAKWLQVELARPPEARR